MIKMKYFDDLFKILLWHYVFMNNNICLLRYTISLVVIKNEFTFTVE